MNTGNKDCKVCPPTEAAGHADRGSLEALRLRLCRPEAPLRLEAVQQVTRENGPGAAELLGARLVAEQDPLVLRALLKGLATVARAAAAAPIAGFLRHAEPAVRATAVKALVMSTHPMAWDWIAPLEQDADLQVREAVAWATAFFKRSEVAEEVEAMLASGSREKRALGLEALRGLRLHRKLELLRASFAKETEPELLTTCAHALVREAGHRGESVESLLGEFEDSQRREYLVEAIRAAVPAALSRTVQQDTAAPAAGMAGGNSRSVEPITPPAVPTLTAEEIRACLPSETDAARVGEMLQAAMRLGVPEALSLAQPFVHSKDRRLRSSALNAVATLESRAARDTLAFLVKDQDVEVAHGALRRLHEQDPLAAVQAVCALFEYKQAWADRQAVALIGELGERAALPFVIERLEHAQDPAFVTAASRLVISWGDRDTLDELVQRHGGASAAGKQRLREMGLALGRSLGISPEVLDCRFPRDGSRKPAEQSKAPLTPEAGLVGRRWARQVAVVLAGIVAIVWLWNLREPSGSAVHQDPLKPSRGIVGPIQGPVRKRAHHQAPSTSAAPAPGSPFESILSAAMAQNTMPTVEQAEEDLRRQLEAKGVRSREYTHLLALDRADRRYVAALQASEKALAAGDPERASSGLQDALSGLPPEHLLARIRLLEALENTCLRAKHLDCRTQAEANMQKAEKALLELCMKAAQESGLPDTELRGILARLETHQKEERMLGKAVAFLNGAQNSSTVASPRAEKVFQRVR